MQYRADTATNTHAFAYALTLGVILKTFRMTKSFIKKGLTLLSSLSLVILFLLYRVGTFDKSDLSSQASLQTSHNGGNINPSTIDTPSAKKDSVKPLMLSSSKVLILADKKPTFLDTLKKNPFKYRYPKSETEILSSSKSAIIFKPQQTRNLNLDSFKVKYDTIKTKNKKGQ
jgi:hypothetical protein